MYGIAVTYAARPGIEDPTGEAMWIKGFEPTEERTVILSWHESDVDAARLARATSDMVGEFGMIRLAVVQVVPELCWEAPQ